VDPLESLLSRCSAPEQAVVRAARQLGYLSPAQLQQSLQRVGSSGGLLPALGESLTPAQRRELAGIHHEAQAAAGATRIQATRPFSPGSSGTVDPDRVGPYAVERRLAAGGMGVVYVARHEALGRRVALKLMLTSAADAGPEAAERFLIEAQAAARLRHPNIVGIHDVGQDGGRPYLALDLVDGESLKDRVDREGPLDPTVAAVILEKLARAVFYAHSNSILHRDIKPHNVLLDADGEPLLTDFGLAKDVSAEGQGITVTGQMLGTPAYMPPEQAGGEPDRVDRRADVYSLGATLYECLCGRPPFQGATVINVVQQVLLDDPPRPRGLRADVPRDLETICLKCLEKEPERRYASAHDLAADLRRFLDGEPIGARRVGPLARVWRRARRNRLVVAVATAVALLVLGVWGWKTVEAQSARKEAESALVDAQRSEADAVLARDEAIAAKEALSEALGRVEAARRGEELARRHRAALAELEQGYALLATERFELAARAFARGYVAAQRLEGEPGTAGELSLSRMRQAAALGAREALSRLPRYLGPDSVYSACALSRSGKLAATAGRPGLQVWDLTWSPEDPRALLWEAAAPEGAELASCAFSPDDQLLVSCLGFPGDSRGRIEVRALEDGALVGSQDLGTRPHCLRFSPRGDRIAVAGQAGEVRICDARTLEVLFELTSTSRPGIPGYETSAYDLDFTEDGQALVVGYADGTVWFWNLGARQALEGHINAGEAVVGVRFTPPGGLTRDRGLAVVTGSGRVLVYDLARMANPRELLSGELGGATTCALSADGRRLAVGTLGGAVMVWDEEGRVVSDLAGLPPRIDDLALAPDGRRLLIAGRGPVELRDLGRARRYEGRGPLAVGHDGSAVWIGEEPGELIYRAPRGEPEAFTVPDLGQVDTLAVGGGHVLAAHTTQERGGYFHRLDYLRTSGERRAQGFLRNRAQVLSLSPAGDAALVGAHVPFVERGFGSNDDDQDDKGRVALLRLQGFEWEREFRWHVLTVQGCAWTPDGAGFVSISQDGTLANWDLEAPGQPRWIRGIQRDGSVDWQPPATRQRLGEDDAMSQVTAGLACHDRRLLTGSGDGALRLHDLEQGALLDKIEAHVRPIDLCAWVGDHLLLSSSSGELKLWDTSLPGGRVLRTLRAPGATHAAHGGPDGTLVAVATADAVWVWDLSWTGIEGFEQDPEGFVDGRTRTRGKR
jgi:eukaryotic-like serine/threonine-protein kinase